MRTPIWAGVLLLAASLTACQSGAEGTIKLGAIVGLTGDFLTEDVARTATQVFNDVNAAGGVNGRKIEYIVKDDAGDPQRTAQVARELADADVVAMAGSASFTDCDVNGDYYTQAKLSSVMGIAASPKCFRNPNIAPVNVGPFTLITTVLHYASSVLKAERICNFTVVLPGSEDAVKKALERWSRLSGKQLVVNDIAVQQSGDLTPYLLRAKQANCDAVLFNAGEQLVVPWLQAAKNQGMSNVNFLLLAPAYTESVATAVGGLGLKVFAGTEFEPYTEDNEANKDWRDTVTRAGAPATAFSQGGYLSAKFMVEVLKNVEGDVTKDSVNTALRVMKPISDPLTGSQFYFGPDETHAPNQAAKIVRLKQSKWVVATPRFITLPSI